MRLPSITCYKGLSLVPAVGVLNLKMPPLLWAVLLVICSATYLTSQDALRSPHPHHTPEPKVGVLGSHGELWGAVLHSNIYHGLCLPTTCLGSTQMVPCGPGLQQKGWTSARFLS